MKKLRLLPLALLLLTCDPVDDRLTIVNETNQTIFFELSDSDAFKRYPIEIEKADTLWDYMNFVRPNDEARQPLMGKRRWERYINQDCTDSTLTVFIFDGALLKSVPPDSLIAKQLYTKKLTYKVKDLENLNWRIEYE